MNLILAIDQSTSATKAVLFDAAGKVVDKASRAHRQIYPQPGRVEHDAEEIWSNTLAAAGEVIARNPGRGIACVSIANQRETVVVWDRASGRPLHHALVWQDRRGEDLCQRLDAGGYGDLVRGKTGLTLDAYFSASKLHWLVTEMPEIAGRLDDGSAFAGTVDAYLIHRLTGGGVFATDFTNASRTLLFDIVGLCWDPELCALFKVPVAALPDVRESAASFGATDLSGILPRPVPIVGVMGDSQASLFACGGHEAGAAKATFGTGTSVLLTLGGDFKLSSNGTVTALAGVWKGRPTYAFEGLINYSAATLSWLENQLHLIGDAAEAEELALAVEDNGGVYFVPAFSGLGAPYRAPDARAALLGMTAFTRREHVVRAALEAIAYQLRDVLDMMRAEAGLELREIHADGGPTRNNFLMQFTADITGAEMRVAETADASAWGAAMNGLRGLGLRESFDDLPRASRSFPPRMDPALVRRYHDGWLAAVKRVI